MRKGKVKKHRILPDPKFGEIQVTKFVNNLMKNGKKHLAYKIFYNAIDIVSDKTKNKGLDIWKKSIENVTPQVEVRSRRIGGSTFQIPQEVRPERKQSLAMKWLIKSARERKGKSMSEKLASEIISAYNNEGGAVKKKEDMHRMAEANKAFAHFKI